MAVFVSRNESSDRLLVRPTAEINLLNMATLVLASAAGIGLILRPVAPKWLIPASLCLLCSVIPTVFGAVFVLYAAPVTLLLAGVGLKVFRTLAGVQLLRAGRCSRGWCRES